MVTLCITVRSHSAGLGDRPIREWEEWFPTLAAAQEREAALLTPPRDPEAYRVWCEQTVSCQTRVDAHEADPYAGLRARVLDTAPAIPLWRPGFQGFQ